MARHAGSRREQRVLEGRSRRWPYVLVATVLTLTAAGAALGFVGAGQVQRATIEGLVPVEPEPLVIGEPGGQEAEPQDPPPPAILNVLLVGLDTREGLTEEEQLELHSGDVEGSRADTIMLAQVRTDGSAGALLSIPRDLRVTLCDGSTGKINAAYAIGESIGEEGGSCLVQTVSDLTGVAVNHYMEVDFSGFVEVIDALGGVELCPEEPMVDRKAGLDLPAGCQQVDGAQALAFARARSMDDDFGRMQRQQELLKALLDGVTSGGVASDISRTLRVLPRIADAVRADDGLGLGAMRDLAGSMRDLGPERLVTHQLPADPQMISGIAYVIEREAEAEELYASFRDGTVLATAAAQSAERG